jgi:hypothetical protein
MISILGVHGVGYLDMKHERAEIVSGMSRRWTETIAKGLGYPAAALDVTCAYYSPFLARSYTPQSDPLDALPDGAKDMFMEWLEDLGAPPVVAQGRMGWPLRQGAQWAQKRFPGLTQAAIAAFFREVDAYLRTPSGGQRTAARDEVAQTIREHPSRVVIAHSLGSVVTYEAFWAYPDLTADLLITIGSPLGMRPVLSRLEPGTAQSQGCRPPGVRRWVNVADPGDPVAVPHKLRELFSGIIFDREDSIGAFSIHSATAYLECAAVAATIAWYLTED